MDGGAAAEQIVKLSMDGAEVALRITGSLAKEGIVALLALLQREQANPTLRTAGAEWAGRMIKSGKPLDMVAIKNGDLKQFAKKAKQYGITYAVVRDKEVKDSGYSNIFVLTEDMPRLSRILDQLESNTVAQVKPEPIPEKAPQEQAAPEAQQTEAELSAEMDKLFSPAQSVPPKPVQPPPQVRPPSEKPPAAPRASQPPTQEELEKLLVLDGEHSPQPVPPKPVQPPVPPPPVQQPAANPIKARTEKSRPSEPSLSDSRNAGRDIDRRPSTRKELEDIDRQLKAKKPAEPKPVQGHQHQVPPISGRKFKKKER